MAKEFIVLMSSLIILLLIFIVILICVLLSQKKFKKESNKKDYVIKRYYHTLKVYELALDKSIGLLIAKNVMHTSKNKAIDFFVNSAVQELRKATKNENTSNKTK